MTEPTIICPNCKTEFPLTESLAAPLLAATRNHFEQQLAQRDEDIAKREQSLRDKEKQLADTKRTLEEEISDQVAAQLKAERARVVAKEAKKAKLASAAEWEAKVRELSELHALCGQNKGTRKQNLSFCRRSIAGGSRHVCRQAADCPRGTMGW
jgi:uncharacterized Zn finger protein (UPF0148 family)